MYLAEYQVSFRDKVEKYELPEAQLEFTVHPAACITLSKEDPSYHPVLVMEKGELVTFFVLHGALGRARYSDNPRAILLRSLSTDQRFQRQGYAKAAMQFIPDFVRANYPNMNEIVLAVNIRNQAAQSLYKACGYVDKGVRQMGKNGELVIMHYYL